MTAEQEQKTKRKGGTMVQLPRFKMALVPKQKKTRRDKRHGGDGNEPSAPPARVVFRNQEIQTAIEGLTASLNAKEQSINRSESEIKEIDELLPSVFPLVVRFLHCVLFLCFSLMSSFKTNTRRKRTNG